MKLTFDDIGLKVPAMLLPKAGVDMTAWAIVACDQYTSQPGYWEDAATAVGDKPSTLKMILPEVYLESDREEEIIASVNQTMSDYLTDGILVEEAPGFILVDRKTSQVESRKGLIVALDLEHYDFTIGSQTLMRATEGTILDRLPPRVRVRQDAPIELPHIMVLIDDPDRTVIEPLFNEPLETAYDCDLMAGGGHIKGYRVNQEAQITQVATALTALADKKAFEHRYRVSDKGVLLYAMGDGNHSFATAKAIWEETKKNAVDQQAIMDHPARYALVELVNIHDAGLEFEPIHRVIFNLEVGKLMTAAAAYFQESGSTFSLTAAPDLAAAKAVAEAATSNSCHAIAMVTSDGYGVVQIDSPNLNLVVATLQSFLDTFLAVNPATTIDYIHGDDVVTNLGSKPGNIGFFLPAIDKSSFFRTIIVDEALPRKTFSMGEADEKRYYLECRRITE